MGIFTRGITGQLERVNLLLRRYEMREEPLLMDKFTLDLVMNKNTMIPSTVNDLLEAQIIGLLKLGYDFNLAEQSIRFDIKHTILWILMLLSSLIWKG